MDRIVSWVAVVVLALVSFFLFQQASSAKADAAAARKEVKTIVKEVDRVRKTHVDAGLLSQAHKFTFAAIEDSFSKVAQDKGMTWRADIEFKWNYKYEFGFDIPTDWRWNLKEVEPGVVSLDVPPLRQLNTSDVAVTQGVTINKASGTHLTDMTRQVQKDAEEIVRLRANYYLGNETIQKTAKAGLASFILNILNSNTPKDKLPLHKVIVNVAAEAS
ncbi:hypothetical protein [Massilia endophytica]|uniref:hypothetical protein n=1 Tax=Massilia endophytica TaxID=2899220 RepID=UPI001E5C952C|nr:hypothetical protein [Massilia endophytica]UGQ45765.1 hypothetical protein LSQ66_18535 [Massilia endophytica]